MIRFRKTITPLITITLILCACDVKDPIYEPAPPRTPPVPAKITLATDWSARTEGIDRPANYTVVIDNQELRFTEETNLLPELDEGTYPIYVYNTPENITVAGTTATVKTTGNLVDPLLDWLFTAATEAVYTDAKEETITATMVQQIRQLSFELNITRGNPDALQSVTASLSGVANGMDFKTNTYTGSGLSVIPVLTRENVILKGTVRLIGLTTEPQVLTLDITYSTGKTQQLISDLSNQLSNFNAEKHIAITLASDMVMTNQAEFETTVTEWKVNQENIIAN